MATYFTLSVQKQGLVARVDLNDVPLYVWTDPENVRAIAQVNTWIMPHRNVLRIRLDWPEDVAFAPGSAKLEASMMALAEGADAAAAQRLVEFNWPTKEVAERGDEKSDYPADTIIPFMVADPPPSEFWTLAKPVELTPEARPAILDVVRELHASFSARRIDRIMRTLKFKTKDVSKANYLTQQEGEQGHRDFLQSMMEGPDWAMEPFKPEGIELHLVANGRAVWVTEKNYEPVLQQKATGGGAFKLPVYLAFIEGKWTVVR